MNYLLLMKHFKNDIDIDTNTKNLKMCFFRGSFLLLRTEKKLNIIKFELPFYILKIPLTGQKFYIVEY